MRTTRHLIATTLIASLGLGLSLSASAHGGDGYGERGGRGEWHERHHHRHRGWDRHQPSYYVPAPVYAAPPRVVYERQPVYAPQPVYAYPSQPAVVIGIPPLVIPLR